MGTHQVTNALSDGTIPDPYISASPFSILQIRTPTQNSNRKLRENECIDYAAYRGIVCGKSRPYRILGIRCVGRARGLGIAPSG